MPQKVERPTWLMPGWVALTSHGNGCPIYIDEDAILCVSGRPSDAATLYLSSGGAVVVVESAQEVIAAISRMLG